MKRPTTSSVAADERAKLRLLQARSFSDIVGQEKCIVALKTFGELYKSRNTTPEHVLVAGSDGSASGQLSQAFAKEYNTGLHEVTAETLLKKGDLTAVLTSVDPGEALILRNIHILRPPLAEILKIALQDYRVDLILGVGPAQRAFPYQLNRFTCIATAPKASDLQNDLSKCFSLSVSVQPYLNSELVLIALGLAKANGLTLTDDTARLLVSVSGASPSAIEQLIRRIVRLGKTDITLEESQEVLLAFGLKPSTISISESPALGLNLDELTGIEFEKMIACLLQRMGFQAEMTKTTGDGGIDIVANLDQPLVGGRYLIQCKRFSGALIGAPIVREFYGAVVADRKALKGILITTSGFTEQAFEFAQNLPLELIDRDRLEFLLAHYR